jgi:hypothetical protein
MGHQALASWMRDVTLPFWAKQGFDARLGLFHERLLVLLCHFYVVVSGSRLETAGTSR